MALALMACLLGAVLVRSGCVTAFDAGGRGAPEPLAQEDAGTRPGGAADAAADAEAAGADSGGGAPASGAEAAPDGRLGSSAGGTVPGGEFAAASSAATFLADLARLASASSGSADAAAGGAAGTAAGISVTWDVDDGLVPAARAVLDAYASDGDALVTSGCLDLRGRVWGAVLRGADWVDVATVWGAADDARATVRVTRLLPGGAPA